MNFIKPTWLAPSNIQACTTTREGGFSSNPYAQFNLAAHVGEEASIVEKNRSLLKEKLKLPSSPVWLSQIHSTKVIEANPALPTQEADASFTQQKGIVCAVLTADCLPILLCNEAGTYVAAIHAGWKGLAAGIIEATLTAAPVPAETLMAWLGPAIGKDAFEVGEDARSALLANCPEGEDAFKAREEKGKWLCDIYHLARVHLEQGGVQRIFGGEYCTFTQHNQFYSYRRNPVTGRMASLIWMMS